MADELRITSRPNLERPTLIAAFRGWNDGGQGASLAAGYLATGKELLVTPEHALHVLEIMLQAQVSGRDGQAKPVQSRFTPPEFPEAGHGEPAHLMHDRTRKELPGHETPGATP